MKKWFTLGTLVLVFSLGLTGCNDGEKDDLAKAQDCLDGITENNYAQADSCIAPLAKYDSQQANILKCSGKFLAGGLTTSKIIDAYKEYDKKDGGNENKDAIFISYLALTPSSKAKEAAAFCRKTELEGYIYLGDLAVVGSILSDIANGFSNPPTQAEVDAALATCQTMPSNCEPAALADAVESVANSYCKKPSAKEDDVCKDINAAVAEAGGDKEVLTQALTCLLGGKTYSNGTCS